MNCEHKDIRYCRGDCHNMKDPDYTEDMEGACEFTSWFCIDCDESVSWRFAREKGFAT